MENKINNLFKIPKLCSTKSEYQGRVAIYYTNGKLFSKTLFYDNDIEVFLRSHGISETSVSVLTVEQVRQFCWSCQIAVWNATLIVNNENGLTVKRIIKKSD